MLLAVLGLLAMLFLIWIALLYFFGE